MSGSVAGPRFSQKISTIRWALPVTLALIAIAYQLGPSRWVHARFDDAVHFAIEIVFFGTTGPLLAYWALRSLDRWFDEKEKAETQARMMERRLAAITTSSADAILSLDTAGRITSWNRGAHDLFSLSPESALGKSLSEVLRGGEAAGIELQWIVDTTKEAGFIRGYETSCIRSDGSSLQAEITASRIEDDLGQLQGLSVILRDITERKLREAEIQRLNASLNEQVADRTRQLAVKVEELGQANAELQKLDQLRTEFVSLVSHQIRAPLTNMSGAVQRMQADCRLLNPTCQRMFAILDQQTARLDRLVQDVLNAVRLESEELNLEMEPVSVIPLIHEVVEQTRPRTNNRQFLIRGKPGLPLVYADRDRVAEVLSNLLDNADKYSAPDGRVQIKLRADETTVTISVQDEGPGLPDEVLARVFDKFYRTDGSDSQRAYGYGLGLYVCRRLVEAQGGRIWAENHPEGGAVFSFSLPAWREQNG